MVYDIVFEPSPILHARAAEVEVSRIKTHLMQRLFKDMTETMYVKEGVGLAAVQIGVAERICTIIKTYNAINRQEDLVLINPTWTKLERHQEWDEEGCLSVPGRYGKIKRYTKIIVTALNKNGQPLNFIAENFFARIIQHECDHLNGHLYIERAKDIHSVERPKSNS